MSIIQICSNIKNNGWKVEFDSQGQVPYSYKGKEWVGYEDVNSLKIKMDWVKKNGYGGGMMWAIDLDDFRGECGEKHVLLKTMHNQLFSQSFLFNKEILFIYYLINVLKLNDILKSLKNSQLLAFILFYKSIR